MKVTREQLDLLIAQVKRRMPPKPPETPEEAAERRERDERLKSSCDWGDFGAQLGSGVGRALR